MEAEKAQMAAAGEEVRAQGKIVLATVKGDVHDIGKNIVGVVLACNNYEVIDLGVMVPAEKILERAKEVRADIIGLSGLITPSLDEMVHVAREMERQGLKLPLLIGGATTSRAHTAVKIAPHYSEPVVHVLDASRAVPVTTSLLSEDGRAEFVAQHRAEYDALRKAHAAPRRSGVPLETARARRTPIEWRAEDLAVPEFLGVRVLEDFPLATLREFIDWSPFFHTWELKGVYPRILEDERQGEQARQIFAEANVLLDRIIAEKLLTARAVYGFFAANAVGDDVELYTDGGRGKVLDRVHFLRQQSDREGKRALPFACGFRCASGDRAGRHHRSLRGDERDRIEGARRSVQGRARRLQRDHGGGDRGPTGRGVCGMPAQARARGVGLRTR